MAPRSILFFAKNPHNVVVYERVLRRLFADPRFSVRLSSKNSHFHPPNAIFDPFGFPPKARVHHSIAALRRHDLYLSPDMMLLCKRARVKVHTFHGISIKGKAFSEKALAYDRLFLIGPYQRRRFVERGILAEGDPRFVEIGMPKTDAFFDGSLDRARFLADRGLDPARKTVLYAPTWRPECSLYSVGDELIRSMAGAPWNFMVKLHDLCYDPATNPVDWNRRLPELAAPNIATLRDPDATPALFAADLLISDASSVANEFALLDRPIVFIETPALFKKYEASIDLEHWGQKSGPAVSTVPAVHRAIEDSLSAPSAYADARKLVADEGFYNPGRATDAAFNEICRLVGLEPPPRSAAVDFTSPEPL